MHVLTVSLPLFKGITSGMRSCIIVDESEHYLVNTEIGVTPDTAENEDTPTPTAVCSINSLATSSEETGLKKGHALVCLSVVRMQ